jgi:hypothetical protein
MKLREKEAAMKTRRTLVATAFVGVLFFATGSRANAQSGYSPDPLSQLLYGLVLGAPYNSTGNFPYDPYGASPSGPYGSPQSYDPYGGLGRGGVYEPARGPYPNDYYQDRDNRYRYQERLGDLDAKYDKAMRRLDRQEYEAKQKAYRKADGNPYRYRDRMAEIDRKYDKKRYQVERNTTNEYRKLSDKYRGW